MEVVVDEMMIVEDDLEEEGIDLLIPSQERNHTYSNAEEEEEKEEEDEMIDLSSGGEEEDDAILLVDVQEVQILQFNPEQEDDDEEDDWNLCTQLNQDSTVCSPVSRSSTPEVSHIPSSFLTPSPSHSSYHQFNQFEQFNSFPQENYQFSPSPQTSPHHQEISFLLPPLSTDRMNSFQSQAMEEDDAEYLSFEAGDSLPLLPLRLSPNSNSFTLSHLQPLRASSLSAVPETVSIKKRKKKIKLVTETFSEVLPVETKQQQNRKKFKSNENILTLNPSLPLPSISSTPLFPLPSLIIPAADRLEDPMQAEMDAFFGFIDPHKPPPPLPPIPSPLPSNSEFVVPQTESPLVQTYTKEQKGKGREIIVSQPSVQVPSHSAKQVPEGLIYQLEPIPTISTLTGQAITEEEKRLAIITSLQRLTLSILSQLISSAIPPPSSTSAITSNVEPESNPSQVSQGQTQTQSSQPKPKLNRKPVAAWKPIPVIVNLAKRVDGTSYDPTASNPVEVPNKIKRIVYPRKNPTDCGSPALARLLKVIEYILDGLKRKVVSTKRDLYYRSVKLFARQSTVDTLVEDIAATLKVRRCDLNIVAASKGLFGGFIKILGTDGVFREGGDQGCLIPPSQSIKSIEITQVDWVLIIEKEAVFQSLCSLTFLEQIPNLGRGVLLTGKGYPDVATRELVHSISVQHPSIPLLCLIDSDPHGLEILSTYKFGSASLAFDNSNLAVTALEWLGVKGSEWNQLGIERDELLEFGKGDRKKALGMLKREWWPQEWRNELENMLHLGRKAEIQILSSAVAANAATFSLPFDFDGAEGLMTSNLSAEEGGGKGSRLFEYVAQKIITRIS